MCGLTGYILRDSAEQNPKTIREMLELQRHRGPDDSGIVGISTLLNQLFERGFDQNTDFEKPCNAVFGFNRLSILDLSQNGHQPMISTDKQVVLMLNGEIYNAFDFKDELISKGYEFKSETDTEVVLHLYAEYGMDGMIHRLNGMFAIVILDLRIHQLFLARDRFGIKPLYILRKADRMAFSSEMKSFKALPNFQFTLEQSHLDEFLVFRNLVHKTLFKNITNVTPGTYVRMGIDSWKEEIIPFYDVNQEGQKNHPVAEAKKRLTDALQHSVKRQMVSDVKLGAQLSGGVDSSLVTYFAAQELKKDDLETVSITFQEKGFSEEEYVDIVAEKLHLKSRKFELRADYYLNNLEEATWHFEQPLNHPNTIGIYFLSEEAKKHVTVLLSGEGADEILAGYGRFIVVQKNPLFNFSWYKSLVRNKFSNLRDFLLHFVKENRIVLSSSFTAIPLLRKIRNNFDYHKAVQTRIETYKELRGSEVTKHRKYEILTYLPDLLMRQDKMSMAHSIENRVPFLDNEMVEAALNIPDDVLIQKVNQRMEGKKVLKDICAEIFSCEFAYRDKMGFGIPLRSFFASPEFQNKWQQEFVARIENRGIFSTPILQKYMQQVSRLSSQQLDVLWLMIAFEIWAHQYLD